MDKTQPTELHTPSELNAFLRAVFPHAESLFSVESVTQSGLILRCTPSEQHLRPGNTLSGPLLMTMADTAMYLAIFSRLGPVAMAVTTNLTMSFLRKAPMSELRGHTRLLKLCSRLATGDVTIFSEGLDEPVAHASVTYAIPRQD